MELTRTERKRLRQEKAKAEITIQKRKQARRSLLKKGVTVLILLGGLVLVGHLLLRDALWGGPGTRYPNQGNLHISSVEIPHLPYNSDPPTSGPHVPYLASWGVHRAPIPPEVQVHNLEDGGVLIQYNCRDCDSLVAELEKIAAEFKEGVIVAPYPTMKFKIALTAWGRLETLERLDPAKIREFIKTYRGIDHHVPG
ncbi:MAG: DUF3105 domain-containing protein [Candidatus Tectomicrobia bacterium]|uniref:DUF3105 domain-containing protein n=1 Tax=Tectimicrobiota bacterium TaxID=2528274 RepID=A0A932GMH2_UNCTE|nr:DUF3105 domain-containing protein [Candidatus Tectomicrobia bacterium]